MSAMQPRARCLLSNNDNHEYHECYVFHDISFFPAFTEPCRSTPCLQELAGRVTVSTSNLGRDIRAGVGKSNCKFVVFNILA